MLDVKLILTTVFTIATLSYTSMVYTHSKFRWNSSFQQNVSTFHDIFNLANYMIKYVLIFEYKIYTYEISVCNRRYALKRRKGIINKNNLKFSLYKFTEIRSHFNFITWIIYITKSTQFLKLCHVGVSYDIEFLIMILFEKL